MVWSLSNFNIYPPPANPSNTIITSGSGLSYTLNNSVLPSVTNVVISFYNPNVYITSSSSQVDNLTIQNGLTVQSGTLNLPTGSITNAMLATPYVLPSILPATSFSGSVQMGSNYSSTDAQNTGLFISDAKATTTASVSGIIIPSSLVQVTQLPIYSGGYKQISNGLQITVMNTATNSSTDSEEKEMRIGRSGIR